MPTPTPWIVRRLLLGLLLGIAWPAVTAWAAPPTERVVTIATRPGVSVDMLVIRPDGPIQASLLVYVGGAGAVGLKPGRTPGKRGGNFLFRTADRFAAAGFLVALIDNPSDSRTAVWNMRSRADHAADAAAAIAFLRAEALVPVWAIGTSMGTVSAAAIAVRLPPPAGPDGVILTSSITKTSRNTTETVLTLDLERITVPLLVASHQDDGCFASPPDGAEMIIERTTGSPRRHALSFSGGNPPESDECEPFAGHGFFGVEDEVVRAIADWITP